MREFKYGVGVIAQKFLLNLLLVKLSEKSSTKADFRSKNQKDLSDDGNHKIRWMEGLYLEVRFACLQIFCFFLSQHSSLLPSPTIVKYSTQRYNNDKKCGKVLWKHLLYWNIILLGGWQLEVWSCRRQYPQRAGLLFTYSVCSCTHFDLSDDCP